ncbi:MAG: cysteine hydrolase [Anaerolineae bacterium]|nr:cysteine hydrolase [Anaerolineae bacterium]
MLVDTSQLSVRRLAGNDRLPTAKTALIIIDMMNRFCDPAWLAQGNAALSKWYADELAAVIPNTGLALDAFRKARALVVHVVTGTWTAEGRELVPYMRGRDYDFFDTEPMSVIQTLAPVQGEIVIRKSASSAFTGTGLDYLLRNAGIEHAALCGQFGNACVFYSLIQSREFGFKNYWIEDALLYGNQTVKDLLSPLVGSQWAVLTRAAQLACALADDTQPSP